MATLIVECGTSRRAGALKGRVVIGRRTNSHIVISDRYVSRIHAWIGPSEDGYFIADTGSRSGTRVNGALIEGRHPLADGDKVRIGPAIITFRANGSLPPDAQELDLSDRPTESDDGIFMDCACGAPLWAPWDFAGRVGQCRYCGQMLELPKRKRAPGVSDPCSDTMAPGMPSPAGPAGSGTLQAGTRPRPARVAKPSIFDSPGSRGSKPKVPEKARTETLCGACQSSIGLLEETTRCPDCGVAFHANCWVENRGCSSYGCKQVGILDPHPEDSEKMASDPPTADPHTADSAVQWEYLPLALALVGSVIGVLSFGIPALLAGVAIFIFRWRNPAAVHRRLMIAAWIVCLAMAMAGFAISWYWWLSGPVAPRLRT